MLKDYVRKVTRMPQDKHVATLVSAACYVSVDAGKIEESALRVMAYRQRKEEAASLKIRPLRFKELADKV